ncbi:MAG: hypothetical protein KC994_26720, partial [Candidatus Omnitrophica bacterium]|nr:hypothetical protein [Candidatus Omnitrophota bacterium]
MAHRPSLVARLTPEEILEYWSLLSAEQKAAFIQKKLEAQESLEGIQIGYRKTPLDGHTLFDRFAGLFHAFASLRRNIKESIDQGNHRNAVALLYGKKFDSLPTLLKERLDDQDQDPVNCY